MREVVKSRSKLTSGGGPRPAKSIAGALDAHCLSLGNCRKCGLADPAPIPIVSEARSPKVMLVGQAPGKTEITAQKPFAGRAGKTLFKWLAEAGIDESQARRHIYISAITRCYPGPSPSGRGDRVPSPAEQEMCESWLLDELKIIRPALLIPVGRLAIDYFLEPAPLDEIIGKAHTVLHAGGESLTIPLPHPSGASSWIHGPGHPDLVRRALRMIGDEWNRLHAGSRASAA